MAYHSAIECQHPFNLGFSSRLRPDGTVAILPSNEQLKAPKGLFD